MTAKPPPRAKENNRATMHVVRREQTRVVCSLTLPIMLELNNYGDLILMVNTYDSIVMVNSILMVTLSRSCFAQC